LSILGLQVPFDVEMTSGCYDSESGGIEKPEVKWEVSQWEETSDLLTQIAAVLVDPMQFELTGARFVRGNPVFDSDPETYSGDTSSIFAAKLTPFPQVPDNMGNQVAVQVSNLQDLQDIYAHQLTLNITAKVDTKLEYQMALASYE
jgi:hypothetical protein